MGRFYSIRFKKNKKDDREEEFNNYSDEDDEGRVDSVSFRYLLGPTLRRLVPSTPCHVSIIPPHLWIGGSPSSRLVLMVGEGSNAAPASMVPGPGDSTLRKNFFQLQENNRTLTDEEPSRVNKDHQKPGRSGSYAARIRGSHLGALGFHHLLPPKVS